MQCHVARIGLQQHRQCWSAHRKFKFVQEKVEIFHRKHDCGSTDIWHPLHIIYSAVERRQQRLEKRRRKSRQKQAERRKKRTRQQQEPRKQQPQCNKNRTVQSTNQPYWKVQAVASSELRLTGIKEWRLISWQCCASRSVPTGNMLRILHIAVLSPGVDERGREHRQVGRQLQESRIMPPAPTPLLPALAVRKYQLKLCRNVLLPAF